MNFKTLIPDTFLNAFQRNKREKELKQIVLASGIKETFLEIEINRNYPILFAGYPKSGNTWLRFLLYHYFELQKNNLDQPLKYSELNSLQCDSIEKGLCSNTENHPEIIRTHFQYFDEFSSLFPKKIYIYRHPLDVLVSAWYFFVVNRRGSSKTSPNNNIDNYVKYNLINWVNHYKTYENVDKYETSYELLKSDPTKELKRLLLYLDIEINEHNIKRAVKLSDFNAIKKMTIESGETHGSGPEGIQKGIFTRKGEIGGYKNELKKSSITFAENYFRKNKINHLYDF